MKLQFYEESTCCRVLGMRPTWQVRLAELVGHEQGRRQEIAGLADLHPSYLTKLLNNAAANPTIGTLQQIASALGLEVDIAFVPAAASGATTDTRSSPTDVVPDATTIEAAARAAICETFANILTAALEVIAPHGPTPNLGGQVAPTRTHPPARHRGRRARS
jgi:transcriptional regulator with XRE-family HTH domain